MTIIAVAIPTFLYVRIINGIDRYEKEPARYLLGAFLWGALPAVIAGILIELILDVPVALVLGDNTLGGQMISTALIPPVVEEILKAGAVAIIYLWRRREFDGWVDGLVYGAMAGFGFAFVENVFYILGTGNWSEWLSLFFLRVIVFGLMHGFWTSLTGIGFGVARNSTNPAHKLLAIVIGLSAAIVSHMVHNGALVLSGQSNGSTILVALVNYGALIVLLICLRLVAARSDRAIMQTYLRDEVPATLSPEAYADLCSTRTHALANLRLSTRQQRAFIQTAAELAQKKRQLVRLGDEGFNNAEIERLRTQMAFFRK
ncbi:MAG TPA: PrsW family intramembrane metalloprotease [Anaerolineae bacterium]